MASALSPEEQARFDQQTATKVRRWLRHLSLNGFQMGLDAIGVDDVSDLYLRHEDLMERLLPASAEPTVPTIPFASALEDARR